MSDNLPCELDLAPFAVLLLCKVYMPVAEPQAELNDFKIKLDVQIRPVFAGYIDKSFNAPSNSELYILLLFLSLAITVCWQSLLKLYEAWITTYTMPDKPDVLLVVRDHFQKQPP